MRLEKTALWGTSTVLSGMVRAVLFAVALVVPTSVMAQNILLESIWGDLLEAPASKGESSFDRSFARQWETHPPRGFPTVGQGAVERMHNAIAQYSDVVSRGGWRPLPHIKLEVGDSHQAVQLLRHRLKMTGDLSQQAGYESTFDSYVERALKRFQARHGLTPTGIVDKPTVMALNVPAADRLRQLRTNLIRLKEYDGKMPDRYVAVNIPSAQIEAVENDQVVSRHSGVVGKVDRQTPILHSNVHEINFNPYWTVPRSIVRKDLVPKAREYARRGKDIMDVYRMNAFDKRGNPVDPRRINWDSESVYDYTFRQDPWKENSMGFVKINFHNKHAVFMHDTPSKSLFGQNVRAESSGCVRVQNVQQLVTWLLRDNLEWSRQRVSDVKRTGERIDVRLKTRVPLYFTYLTGWVTADGMVNFRRDLYNRDNVDLSASTY